MNYIGIDLGTSSVKIVLMDTAGHIIANVSKSYPIDYPKAGWSEQNPYDWYDACIEGMKELLDGQDESTVGGISFGGQMHGLVILDKNDEVIRPAILWNDGRTIFHPFFLHTYPTGRYCISYHTIVHCTNRIGGEYQI